MRHLRIYQVDAFSPSPAIQIVFLLSLGSLTWPRSLPVLPREKLTGRQPSTTAASDRAMLLTAQDTLQSHRCFVSHAFDRLLSAL